MHRPRRATRCTRRTPHGNPRVLRRRATVGSPDALKFTRLTNHGSRWGRNTVGMEDLSNSAGESNFRDCRVQKVEPPSG
jgi:hypothetical protein